MAVLGADPLVGRAVLQSARRAEPHVLVTRRLTVHATLEQPMVRTEVFGADRTAVRASVTAAVVVPADDEGRGRSAALWTRHDPRGGTAEGALRGECRVTPPGGSRLELPLRALHQDASLDELQWMHDGLHPAAPHLFGAAALGERRDGADSLRVGLLLEDRLEVSVQPAELDGKLLLRHGAPRGDTLRRFVPQVAQEETEQVGGLPRGDGRRGSRNRRIRGVDPARFQVPEQARQLVTHLRFLDPGAGAQHHARDQPPHRMHGYLRRAPRDSPIAHGNRQLHAARVARGSRRDQAQCEARGARADRLDQLGQERTAQHRDLGFRVPLQRSERPRDPQGCAVPEKWAFRLG